MKLLQFKPVKGEKYYIITPHNVFYLHWYKERLYSLQKNILFPSEMFE